MVKKRWYDHDPSLSMAVSLLQNSPKTAQLKTAKHMFALIEDEQQEESFKKPFMLSYLFPFSRREKLDPTAWRFLEVLKHLPPNVQREMALNMINYIYLLESGKEDELTQEAPSITKAV